ncbi:hypothetical protein ANANG_G00187760 [Anguilla anguilla]|uniref:Uncharacterized protein n=1 Tax=Anguilla anguilla TaxID=7936 RepID=A0A9D3M3Z7_ANGAN|nr:hypothetical protein ANANG_G00187760 [Anguilla anguilla]
MREAGDVCHGRPAGRGGRGGVPAERGYGVRSPSPRQDRVPVAPGRDGVHTRPRGAGAPAGAVRGPGPGPAGDTRRPTKAADPRPSLPVGPPPLVVPP